MTGQEPARKGHVTKTGPPASKRLRRIIHAVRRGGRSSYCVNVLGDTIIGSHSHLGLDKATRLLQASIWVVSIIPWAWGRHLWPHPPREQAVSGHIQSPWYPRVCPKSTGQNIALVLSTHPGLTQHERHMHLIHTYTHTHTPAHATADEPPPKPLSCMTPTQTTQTTTRCVTQSFTQKLMWQIISPFLNQMILPLLQGPAE